MALLVVGLVVYLIRPIGLIHAPLLYWYTQPLPLFVPLVVAGIGTWWLARPLLLLFAGRR